MEIHKSPTNPHVLFQELSQIFKLSIEAKGLDMVWEIDERIPNGVILDTIRLRQVLVNLLGNAIKFTDQGYIKLIATITNEDEERSVLDLKIDVQDTGKGIDEEYQKIIFQDFEQTQNVDHTKHTGTGLGLSISQRLTELMGGKLSLVSEVGTGSTFTVHLKSVDVSTFVAQDDVLQGHQKVVFEPSTILVVDDVDYNRALVKEHFADTDVNIIEAVNGQEAVEATSEHLPDLVLMDLRMPVMDGYDAAKLIKISYEIPIVALTASVMKDDFDRTKSFNFDAYIRKPVRREELFECLRTFLPSHTVDVENDQQTTVTAQEQLLIPQLLSALKQKMNTWRNLNESNNLSDIQVFSDELTHMVPLHDVRMFRDYAQALHESLNVFDIEQVEQLLKRYPRLIDELDKYSLKTD
jgi:two-component system sensor histidine kinase EvgS